MEHRIKEKGVYEKTLTRAEILAPEMAFVAIIDTDRQDDASDEHWSLSALCAQTGGDAFYPDVGVTSKDAKKICQRCDVVEPCLEAALARDTDKDFGIWGNTTERERRKIRKQRKDSNQAS